MHLCENTTYPGISIDGAFADYVVVPARITWRNPADLPHEIAAMLEPFGIAVHACLEGSGVADQRILINGCDPIGLMAIAAACALGARQVIAADPNKFHRDRARQMGADHGFDPAEVDLAAAVADVSMGAGAPMSPSSFPARRRAFTAPWRPSAKVVTSAWSARPPTRWSLT